MIEGRRGFRQSPAVIDVLIAQRDRLFRDGLRAMLEQTPGNPGICVTAEAAHTQQLMERVEQYHPHVVVLDTLLPKTTPKPLSDLVSEIAPSSRVVLLLTLPRGGIYERVKFGSFKDASGIVLKDDPGGRLIQAILTVNEGRNYVSPSIVPGSSRNVAVINRLTPEEVHYGDLTDKEIEVLRLLAVGRTNKQVSGDLTISVKTVETHRAHILYKLALESRDRGGLTRSALALGLVEPGDIGNHTQDN